MFSSELLFHLQQSPLTDWLNYFAVETWDRIEFGKTHDRNNIFETTLTQNLVFDFYRIRKREKFPIQIYESINERRNGNDLEFIFQIGNKWLHVPCQCKIIGRNSRYEALGRKNKNGEKQIDLLINYAKEKSGIPIYLFYNFCTDFDLIDRIQAQWGFDVQQFGCSIIDANYIKRNYFKENGTVNIPSFDQLHLRGNPDQSAMPFYTLSTFCTKTGIQLFKKRYDKYFNFIDSPIDRYLKESVDLDGWDKIIGPATIGRIPFSNNYPIPASLNYENSFNPSYRLIFTDTSNLSRLSRLT